MLREDYDPHRFDAPEGVRVPLLGIDQVRLINNAASNQPLRILPDRMPSVLQINPNLSIGLRYQQYPSDGSALPYASLMIQGKEGFYSLSDLKISLIPSLNDAFWGAEEIRGVVLDRCISSARFLSPIIGGAYSLNVEKTGWDNKGSEILPEPPFNFEGLRVPVRC